jgi:hypothetical protein
MLTASFMRPFNPRKWRADDPCPCLSGKRAGQCCLTPSGDIRKETPNTIPSAPPTNRGRNGCYLEETNDCGTKLTAEHFVSRTVLEAFPGGIRVSGLPRQAPGEEIAIGIDSASSNILCDRHNSAFSKVDSEAGQFFRALQAIDRDFARSTLSRRVDYRLISGEALELWALKAACGFYYSGIASKDGIKLRDVHAIDFEQVVQALQYHHWGPGAGLYLHAPIGSIAVSRDTLSLIPATSSDEERFVGMSLHFHGLQFELVLDTKAVAAPRWPGLTHHPSHMIFENGRRRQVIQLTWGDGSPFRPVTLNLKRIVRH